jgi:hypothetical protein
MKIVKFKGKFKDLIPDGWEFQKLFARNYRQYYKTCDGEKYSQGCRIWQHLGGYLEVDNLDDDMSALLVQQIIDGKINEWGTRQIDIFSKTKETEIVYWFQIDTQERKFYPKHSNEYKEIKSKEWALWESDPADDDPRIKEFSDRYQSWRARPELIDMLKELVNRKWIVVEEDARN